MLQVWKHMAGSLHTWAYSLLPLLSGLPGGVGFGVLKVFVLLVRSSSSSEDVESGVPMMKKCRMLSLLLVDLEDGVLGGDPSAASGLSFLGRPLLRGGSLGSRGCAARARLNCVCAATAKAQDSLSAGFKSSAPHEVSVNTLALFTDGAFEW